MEPCSAPASAPGPGPPHSAPTSHLEDGELIESDGELDYTPLARPADYKPYLNPASLMSMNIQDDHTDESEHEPSSEPDSDSDNRNSRPKKRKIKFKRHKKSDSAELNKPNKYTIWCKTVQEDTLADDLLVCDVTKNNYLGIETYNHRLNRNFEEDMLPYKDMGEDDDRPNFAERLTNKRRYRDRKNVKLRLGRRNSCDSDSEKGDIRHIPDLIVNMDSTEEEIAKDIFTKLSEEKDNLILRIVENAGKQKAIELFKETKRIEEDGGMFIRNGTRRRTPGGVFIFLLKRDKDITPALIDTIFIEDKLETKEKNKAKVKHRNQKVEELKQSLTDSVLPAIRMRAEQWVAAQIAAEDMNHHVSNPPPSPATDGRDGSSDIDTNNYIDHSPRLSSDVNNLCVDREAAVLPKFTVTKVAHLPQDPRAAQNRSYQDDYLDISCNDDMDLF